MSAAVRSIIVTVLGLLVALVLGSELGKGSAFVPVTIASSCVFVAIYFVWLRAVRLEALVLGLLLTGYIVGNRGFAQLSLGGGNVPLFVGEAAMLICICLVGFRLAVTRERSLPKGPLARAIFIFLIIGAIRLYFDVVLHLTAASTPVAIRDSATVYYSIFFFLAYSIGKNNTGREAIDRCILVGSFVLLPVALVQFTAPDALLRLTVRGYPLISQKNDLLTTYLAFASCYFFLRASRSKRPKLLKLFSVIFSACMMLWLTRAALFAFILACVFLLIARRPQFVIHQLVVGTIALICLGSVVTQFHHSTGVLGEIADKAESLVDFSESHSYRGSAGQISADNNQFRLVWWRSVVDETIRKGPVFGLGFGYDLSADFIKNYYGNYYLNFDARSPHSIWVTVFGRMGILGFLSFAGVVLLLLGNAIRAARKVARREQPPYSLAFWIGAIVILGSASFGVVLEGPMGGILFWSFLGLAASQMDNLPSSEPAPISAPEPRRVGREVAFAG